MGLLHFHIDFKSFKGVKFCKKKKKEPTDILIEIALYLLIDQLGENFYLIILNLPIHESG